MRMHGVGLRLCQVELAHLLTDIRRNACDGRAHFGDDAWCFLAAIPTCLTESCPLGDGADRVDLLWDIARNQLAVAPYPSIQVDEVVHMAKSPNALADRLALLREALTRLARRFHLRRGLLQTPCHLWGAARAAPPRLFVVTLDGLLQTGTRRFSRRHGLFGGTLFGSHRRSDRLAQLLLHMEEVRRVMHPQVVFDIRSKPRRFVARRLDPLTLECS